MMLKGRVLRQRFLPSGKQQTVAVYYRDDVVNLMGYGVRPGEHSDYLIALQGSTVGEVPDATVQQMRAAAAPGTDGMAVLVLQELSISHERISCLGQRSAVERMAHFLCETLIRNVEPGGDYSKDRCQVHVTQDMLSSVLGLSTAHVNGTLQDLRRRSLADLVRDELVVHDFRSLATLGKFDDAYLIRF
jgi:CRP-like cAMP-binding protein